MSTYDVTPDDEPLDVQAVNEDDVLVERLRHALSPENAVVWDDDEDDMDPGYALLRALQLDVSADLPSEPILPAGITELLPRRRHLSRTATMAVVAASVLSIGGAAAASAPGQPLAGARHAVSDAVATAVDAITPDSPVGPAVVEATHSPSPKPSPPGDAVSDAARSAAAVLQIEDNLDRAEAFLDKGRAEPAEQQLDAAARKLNYVTDLAEHARLEARLTALQTRLASMPSPSPKATHGPADDPDKGKGGKGGADSHGPDTGQGGPAVVHTPNANASSSSGRSQSSRGDTTKSTRGVAELRSTPHVPGQNKGLR
jgi:hypothetical protein